MLYIDGTENPFNKLLYIINKGKVISFEFVLKYNEKFTKFNWNFKKVLKAIKSLINFKLVKYFKDKNLVKNL